jgi:hypothetical protein
MFGCIVDDEVWLGTNDEKDGTLEAASNSSHLPTSRSATPHQYRIKQMVYPRRYQQMVSEVFFLRFLSM